MQFQLRLRLHNKAQLPSSAPVASDTCRCVIGLYAPQFLRDVLYISVVASAPWTGSSKARLPADSLIDQIVHELLLRTQSDMSDTAHVAALTRVKRLDIESPADRPELLLKETDEAWCAKSNGSGSPPYFLVNLQMSPSPQCTFVTIRVGAAATSPRREDELVLSERFLTSTAEPLDTFPHRYVAPLLIQSDSRYRALRLALEQNRGGVALAERRQLQDALRALHDEHSLFAAPPSEVHRQNVPSPYALHRRRSESPQRIPRSWR